MTITAQAPVKTMFVGPQVVEEISDLYNEPAWMRAARQEAWALAQEMPLPHQKEEAWRRTRLQNYPLDSLRVDVSGRVAFSMSHFGSKKRED